jgi:hypothetical protein
LVAFDCPELVEFVEVAAFAIAPPPTAAAAMAAAVMSMDLVWRTWPPVGWVTTRRMGARGEISDRRP